jgi:hypothetical protein
VDDGADDFYRGLIRLMRSIALLRSWLSPAQLAGSIPAARSVSPAEQDAGLNHSPNAPRSV